MLEVDGALLTDQGLTDVVRACPLMESLSLIGCKGFGNAGLKAAADGLPCLRRLAVGGTSFLWTETEGLAAFSGSIPLSPVPSLSFSLLSRRPEKPA